MDPVRRSLLGGAVSLPLSVGLARAMPTAGPAGEKGNPVNGTREFGPLAFAKPETTHLDAASSHPISLGALDAVQTYFNSRANLSGTSGYRLPANGPIEKFAGLVNVDPEELAYVQSTTTGEQMVLRALGFPDVGGHVITDTLHFFGSLPMYRELEKQGVSVSFLRDDDGQVSVDDIAQAIRPDTRLIAISLVSTVNGFTHDLERVCRLAHERDVCVYADIIHAAGCVPLDLRATGVDFAACASYKWLMGDFGLGFLYASRDSHERLRRRNYGYYGITRFSSHIYPHDEPGENVVDYEFGDDANGHFALGTRQNAVIAQLDYSLARLNEIGVERIHEHAREHVRHLRSELSKMGFTLYTPPDSRAPMVTCVYKDAREKLGPILADEGVDLTLSQHRFRASVSVYNNESDVEHLLQVLRDRVVGKSAA